MIGIMLVLLPFFVIPAFANEAFHEWFLYPVVRISHGYSGGSGTVVYSGENDEGGFSTYILTNYHVVETAVSIAEEWDSGLQKQVKREKRLSIHGVDGKKVVAASLNKLREFWKKTL